MDKTTMIDKNTHVEVGAKTIPIETKKHIINTIKKQPCTLTHTGSVVKY